MRKIAYTFTRELDSYLVGVLSRAIPADIEWYIFTESELERNVKAELDLMSNVRYCITKRTHDGTNGFGYSGAVMHVDILRQLFDRACFNDDDVLIHLDSDTYINNNKIFEQAEKCAGAIGLKHSQEYQFRDKFFTWVSGCCITLTGKSAKIIINSDIYAYRGELTRYGLTPSNDVMLSYCVFKAGLQIDSYRLNVGTYDNINDINYDFIHENSADKREKAKKLFIYE